MRKNKIGDILFGLLLLGFILSKLTACGQEEQSAPIIAQQTETATVPEKEEQSALQETEELSVPQEQMVFSGPEDRDCTSYVIPDGVREIGDGAFKDCSFLTAIEIPDSVMVIGENAFNGCSSLSSIEIPDSVMEIGHWAFNGCSSLTGIEIPDSVMEIGIGSFACCSSLASIEIPDGVTKIYASVFSGCSSLTGIEIPDGVTEIGRSAFYDCSSLTGIEIPDSVTVIGERAFYGCSSLTSVMLPKDLNIDLSEVFGTRYSDIQFINNTEIVTYASYDMASLEAIGSVCGLVAPVETSVTACHWDSYGEHPYDVVYDFGEDYMAYVNACDWSMVFDAEYYMSQFPMLALQYHYDERELLFHFQTVGVREGRQGSKSFNVCAYAMNGDQDIHAAFGSDYEGYYLYYMLNYDTEKDVNTVTYSDASMIRNQYAFRPTALQTSEVEAVNKDRNDINVNELSMVSETCAFANYRAYLNAHDGWEAHDWAIEKGDLFDQYMLEMGGEACAENTVTFESSGRYGETTEHYYYKSKDHYEAMVSQKYNYIGVSNICNGERSSSQFDYFIDDIN